MYESIILPRHETKVTNRQMYELYDPCTVMFFYRFVVWRQLHPSECLTGLHSRNKHIMIDLGTGNNNKMCDLRSHCISLSMLYSADIQVYSSNWAMDSKQEVRCDCSLFRHLCIEHTTSDDRYCRDSLPRRVKGPWFGCVSERFVPSIFSHSLLIFSIDYSTRYRY